MTDLESNIQAYRTMAEVLVNLRKIIVRGLERVSGSTWYTDGCPAALYERLVERKESELAIQRFTTEYEDLISFATFEDLAEIVEYNDELARLLRNLAPSTELLCARLLELEALRSKLAQGRALSVEEITVITNYSSNLAATLAGARRRTGPSRGAAADTPVPAASEVVGGFSGTDAEPDEEPVEELTVRDDAEERPPAAAAAPVEVAEVAFAGEVATVEEGRRREESALEIEDEPEQLSDAVVEQGEDLAEVHQAPVPATAPPGELQASVDEPGPPTTEPRIGFGDVAADIDRALAGGEERDVLRVLRREVIAVAEAVFRMEENIEPAGWGRVHANGWFGERESELGLEPLAEFHGVVEEYQVGRAEGLSPDELRGMLSARGFSRLLLTLREMFLRNGV